MEYAWRYEETEQADSKAWDVRRSCRFGANCLERIAKSMTLLHLRLSHERIGEAVPYLHIHRPTGTRSRYCIPADSCPWITEATA
jgi:hypothetical protein